MSLELGQDLRRQYEKCSERFQDGNFEPDIFIFETRYKF